MNFWTKLKKPFTVLAPMDDVTDVVFREIVADIGRPDVFFTEFTNVDALNSKGRSKQIGRLEYTEKQRPIVAQIWGLNPENYYKSAKLIQKLGFDGIDINMGCPDKKVMKNGCCAALINNHSLAKEIILSVKKGAPKLPISVKTRLGISKIETTPWINFLLDFNLDAITIHGRTAKELSDVPAHWDEIGKALDLRDERKSKTLIIGNGDILNLFDVKVVVKKFGVDGVMIGRGIFHDIQLFNTKPKKLTPSDKLNLLLKHSQLFDRIWGETKNFLILRRFFKIYINGFDGAKDMRVEFMNTNNLSDVSMLVSKYI